MHDHIARALYYIKYAFDPFYIWQVCFKFINIICDDIGQIWKHGEINWLASALNVPSHLLLSFHSSTRICLYSLRHASLPPIFTVRIEKNFCN